MFTSCKHTKSQTGGQKKNTNIHLKIGKKKKRKKNHHRKRSSPEKTAKPTPAATPTLNVAPSRQLMRKHLQGK